MIEVANPGAKAKRMDPYFERPRGVLTVLADGFVLAWRVLPRAWQPCLLALVLYLLAGPIITALTGEDPNDLGLGTPSEAEAVVEGATAALLLGLYAVFSLFLLIWITAMLMGSMSLLAGGEIEPGARVAVSRVPAMFGAMLLAGLAVAAAAAMLGGLLGVLAGWRTDAAALAVIAAVAFLAMILMLGPGLAVLERVGPIRAMSRSVKLVMPYWARVAALLLIFLLINAGVALILGLLVTVLLHLIHPDTLTALLAHVINPLIGTAFLVVGAGLVCSLYWDLRARARAGG